MKNRIKVVYNDRFDILKKDKNFAYCEIDKDIYDLAIKNNYKGNISIYFIDKDNKEYGLVVDKITEIKVIE